MQDKSFLVRHGRAVRALAQQQPIVARLVKSPTAQNYAVLRRWLDSP